jgi:putative PIN family toxin of toxin-antitoxin system
MKNIVVVDTNVFVASLQSNRGASYQLLQLVGAGLFEMALSVPLVLEYEDAAKRIPDTKRPADYAVENILDYFCLVGLKMRIVHYLWRPFLRDPHDDHVLELAIASRSEAIITYNKRDFSGVEQFGIALFDPCEYLKRLELHDE